MKLLLNGNPLNPDHYSGKKGTTVDIKMNDDTGDDTASVTQEYEFIEDAYTLIESILITPEDGSQNFITVKIFEDSCCASDILLFEGIIRGDMIDWCHGECKVTAQLVEHTEETRLLDCIKSTLVYDNWNGFQSEVHPRIPYCIELRPDFLAHVVLTLGVIVNIILTILIPVVAVISAVVTALQAIEDAFQSIGIDVNLAPGWAEDTSLMNLYNDFVDALNERLIGCGRKHPSPFVRSYIQNVCDKCGITFVSSIYNDPLSDYYYSMYQYAPVEKGTRDESILWIDENHPIKTLDGFLDELKLVHNARWELIGSTLYFERKDYFYNGGIWVNFETEDTAGTVVGKLCLSWRDDKKPAYINLQYSEDPVDTVGNEARPVYNNIVEWNQPFSELQSGHTDILLPFGTPRFRDDNIDEDILGQYSTAPFGLGDQINQFQGVLILDKGVNFQPKLLIWDEEDINFARVKGFSPINTLLDPDELIIVLNHNYNYPYMFYSANAAPNTAYPADYPNSGLYPRFYSIDNPKVYTDAGKTFTFTIRYKCDTLQTALTARWVQLPYGVGRIKQMQINLAKKEITISGDV